jgi:hypothetical protein
MDHYKAKEIAEKYNVSVMTVSRWISNARQNKNSLNLFEHNQKQFIVKNLNNDSIMHVLSKTAKTYKSKLNIKKTHANQKFYNTFDDEQRLTIINAIETSLEIPNKYTFIGEGADIWNGYYIKNSVESNNYPTPQRVMRLLNSCLSYLEFTLDNIKTCNVFDIGQGNALLVTKFLSNLNQIGSIDKYVAVDISDKMNKIAIKNVSKEINQVRAISYVCDTEISNFEKLFFENTISDKHTRNIVLYLGSMIGMHNDPVRVLRNFRLGMRKNDILMISNTLDSRINRADFSYAKNPEGDKQNTWIPECLGIDVANCKLITKYHQTDNMRKLNLQLDKNYEISISLFGQTKTISLMKGQEINVWKHQMSTLPSFLNQLEQADLRLANLCIEKDNSHMLAVCEIKDKN